MKNTKNLFKSFLIASAIILPLTVQGYSNEVEKCSLENPLSCNFKDPNMEFEK